ncbi:MAG: sulfotransferase [Planctomycetota bacterium]|nr:sulfotransferase [Planctomycetota bacterium]
MATTEQLLKQAREYHQQGQMQTALDLYRSAVRSNPRSIDAHTGLGLALIQIGVHAEAVDHLERAVKLDPTSPEAICNLAMAHRSQGRLDEALTCYERAVWMSNKYPRAVAGAAEIYALRGQYGKAHALLLPYISSEQDEPAVALTYARCCRALGKPGDAAPVLAKHLAGQRGTLPTMNRVFMLLELANLAHDLGHPDRAFAAATDANRIFGRRFDADRYNAAIDTTITNWTAERHAELPVSTAESDLPVLVVGMPRAGEALVEQIIASHPDAAPAGETAITRHLVSRLEGSPSQDILPFSRPEALTFQPVNEGAGFYLNTLAMIAKGEGAERPTRIVDRCTHNYLYLGMLDRMLPKSRVIHVRRNPLDTALSCYTNHFDIPYFFKVHLADFAEAYKAYERIMDHWKSVVSLPTLEVDYEDIVSDFETQARRIIEFVGLEWNDACLRFWETPRRLTPFANMGILKPIYDTSAGKHKQYEQFIAPLRAALGMPPAEQPVGAADESDSIGGDLPEAPIGE